MSICSMGRGGYYNKPSLPPSLSISPFSDPEDAETAARRVARGGWPVASNPQRATARAFSRRPSVNPARMLGLPDIFQLPVNPVAVLAVLFNKVPRA